MENKKIKIAANDDISSGLPNENLINTSLQDFHRNHLYYPSVTN